MPSSFRKRAVSHTQPGAQSSRYFCRLKTLGLRVMREIVSYNKHTGHRAMSGIGIFSVQAFSCEAIPAANSSAFVTSGEAT